MKDLVNYIETNSVRLNSLFALLSGALIGVSFCLKIAWPLSLVGIALCILLAHTAPTVRRAFLYGVQSGSVVYACVLGGVGMSLFPFDWYGIGNIGLQIAAVATSWLCASIIFGASIGVCMMLVRFLKTDSWYDIFLIPSLWVLCEWFNAFVYHFYMLGPGSFFGPHFTLGYVGYLLAEDSVLLQLAWFGGVYVLSFSVVLISTLCVQLFRTQKKVYAIILLGMFFLWALSHVVLATSHVEENDEAGSIAVAVISRYMPPSPEQNEEFEKERYEELLHLLLPLRGLDMVVFPENATFLRELMSQDTQDDYAELRKTGKTSRGPMLIDSGDSVSNGIFQSQVTFFGALGMSFGEKQFLLAFGEYIPYLYQFVLKTFWGEKFLNEIIQVRNYVPGDEIPTALVGKVSVAVRFCDEVMSPLLYRTQVKQGAEVLVNISSQSWFQGTRFVYNHMQRIAKVRAVESGRWYIQSGNMAPAFILDHHGKLIAETNSTKMQVIEYSVPARNNATPYILLGQWILVMFALCALTGAAMRYLPR